MSSGGPEELRAIHAARRELGPEYDDALLESFVDRAEAHLRQRLEGESLGDGRQTVRRAVPESRDPVRVTIGPGGLALLLVNALWGVLSSVVLSEAYHERGTQLIVIWMILAVSDAAYLGARIAARSGQGRKRTLPISRNRAVQRPSTESPTNT